MDSDPILRERYEARARVFKALGHPTRLLFVERLERGECCVQELQRLVGLDMSTVSKHLSVLRQAGLVRDRKAGSRVFYSLVLPCASSILSSVDGMLSAGVQSGCGSRMA